MENLIEINGKIEVIDRDKLTELSDDELSKKLIYFIKENKENPINIKLKKIRRNNKKTIIYFKYITGDKQDIKLSITSEISSEVEYNLINQAFLSASFIPNEYIFEKMDSQDETKVEKLEGSQNKRYDLNNNNVLITIITKVGYMINPNKES